MTQTLVQAKPRSIIITYALPLVLAVAALTASAWLGFPHPFAATPVPITWQVLVVLALGLAAPAWLALGSVSAYLTLGLAGAPVFAWGHSGLIAFAGPTGGYLIGFLAAVLVAVSLRKALGDKLPARILSGLAALAAIYAVGLGWLTAWVGSFETAVTAGFLPFILPDLLKLVGALGITFGYQQVANHLNKEKPLQ